MDGIQILEVDWKVVVEGDLRLSLQKEMEVSAWQVLSSCSFFSNGTYRTSET